MVRSKEAKRIAVIDAETDPFLVGRIPEAFIWGFYDGEGPVKYFDDVGELIAFLRTQRLLVYAHNGGRFDYHLGFLRYLDPYSEVTIINGRLARFTIGECEFRDSVNILPIALKDFDKDEIDYAKLEKKVRHKHMAEIKRYLAKDCTSLHTIVSEFISRYGRGLTLAGCAMKTWRKMSGAESVANHDADYFHSLSPFYYGGRVQCFQKGIINEPFNVVDINSAYPYAMLHDHPFSRSYEATDSPTIRGAICPQSLYRCRVISRGALPWRDSHGKLSFPSSDSPISISCTGWELLAALETDTAKLLSIETRYDFPVVDSFKDYIQHFYGMKKAAAKNSPEYIFAKLFMNSLYGKFGANPDNYANYGIVPAQYAEAAESDDTLQIGKHTGGWCAIGTLGPWALLRSELDESEKFFFNVATAASITGFVRAFLWRHACAITNGKGRRHTLLYCDTDSLAFVGELAPFKMSKELGDWSHEGTFNRGAIAGKKLYAFQNRDTGEWKTASKGVKLSAAEIVRLAQGEEIEWHSEAPTFSMMKPPMMQVRKVRMT